MKLAAVDFDDTLCRPVKGQGYGWGCGDPVEGAVRGMHDLVKMGYAIVIWTCRDDTGPIIPWLQANGFPEVLGVNIDPIDYGSSPKIVADVYIDDRAAGWQGWRKAIQWIRNRGV